MSVNLHIVAAVLSALTILLLAGIVFQLAAFGAVSPWNWVLLACGVVVTAVFVRAATRRSR
jgi:hypothetical protein